MSEETKSEAPELPGVAVLLDLAVKRYDLLDRAFDGINTRAGTLFGWSTLISAGATLVYEKLPEGHGWRTAFAGTCLFLWGMMALSCWRAFRVTSAFFPGDPTPLLDAGMAYTTSDAVKLQVLYGYRDAHTEMAAVMARKAAALDRAFLCLLGLVFTLVAGAVVGYGGSRALLLLPLVALLVFSAERRSKELRECFDKSRQELHTLLSERPF